MPGKRVSSRVRVSNVVISDVAWFTNAAHVLKNLSQRASQGRMPKIKSTIELSTPVFTEDSKGKLTLGDNLRLVARALDITDRLA